MILAIDPGTKESACVGLRTDYSIITAEKIPNQKVLEMIELGDHEVMVIECMEPRTLNVSKSRVNAPYQRVGDETYETCIWIGRFMEAAYRRGMDVHRVMRSEERRMLIPSRKNKLPPLPEPVPKSVDAQIRAALVQRFAKHEQGPL